MCVTMTSPGLACVTGLRIQHTRLDAVHGRCRCTAPWPGAAEHCTRDSALWCAGDTKYHGQGSAPTNRPASRLLCIVGHGGGPAVHTISHPAPPLFVGDKACFGE